MVHWIYILKCEGDLYYVGETTRLYRRFWEHQDGCGGLNTLVHPPETIVAIYPVHKLYKFIRHTQFVKHNNYNTGYDIFFDRDGVFENFNLEEENFDYLWTENFITEKLMIDNQDGKNIRGGKYTKFNTEYCFPSNNLVKELPNCHCGFPCDIRKNDDENYLYFRCAKKNMWDKLIEEFEIEDVSCNFFMKYINDTSYNTEYEHRKERIKQLLKISGWLQNLVGCQHEFCIGGCGKTYDGTYSIRYARRAINLCFDCFLDDKIRMKLKEAYSNWLKGKCFIDTSQF